MRRLWTISGVVVPLMGSLSAWAQDRAPASPPQPPSVQPATPPAPAGAPAEAGAPLAGPKVAEKPAPPTLVERDFEGRLKRLEIPAPEAALRMLGLDEAARARAEAVLAERAAILDAFVRENLDLIVQLASAGESGDKLGALRLLYEGLEKLKALRDRGPLAMELAGAIPSEQAAEYWRLVKEYQAALKAELAAEARARGEDARPLALQIRANLVELGEQIKRSVERQVVARAAEFERLLQRLELSPEQEARIRGLVAEFFEKTRGKGTEAQKRNLFLAITSGLTESQRARVIRYFVAGEEP
jgi:hypothetical protein